MELLQKSRLVSFLLTILFGPLGLLYSSIAGGLILTLIAVVFHWTIFIPILCWLLAIILGDSLTYRYNKNAELLVKTLSGDKTDEKQTEQIDQSYICP